MSYLWSFQSFDPAKSQHIFGGGDPCARDAVVRALTWDEDAFDDVDAVVFVAEWIVSHGITYAGLAGSMRELLDDLIPVIFSPEGLAQELDVRPESPDGVHPSVFEEIIARASGHPSLRMLPLFRRGRRHGETETTSRCEYVILTPDELSTLCEELEAVLGQTVAWSADGLPELIRECLLDVAAAISSRDRAAVALLG